MVIEMFGLPPVKVSKRSSMDFQNLVHDRVFPYQKRRTSPPPMAPEDKLLRKATRQAAKEERKAAREARKAARESRNRSSDPLALFQEQSAIGSNNEDIQLSSELTSQSATSSDPTSPAVVTDKGDYAPGETATFTATGFAPGSILTFAVADDPTDPGDDGDSDVYPSFEVTDGGDGYLDGEVNGEVVTTWFVPTDNNASGSGIPDAANATLTLEVTGSGEDGELYTSDDQTATTTFTDSVIGGVDLGQLTEFVFVFTDGRTLANLQDARGYVGDIAVDGEQANEKAEGDAKNTDYSGTIFTNDDNLGDWQEIIDFNDGAPPSGANNNNAVASFNNDTLIDDLDADLNSAFTQINALTTTNTTSTRRAHSAAVASMDGIPKMEPMKPLL